MGKPIFFVFLIALSFNSYSQSIDVQYPSHNTIVSASFYENDTLFLHLFASPASAPSFYKQIKIYKQGNNVVHGNFYSNINTAVQSIERGTYMKVGLFYVFFESAWNNTSQYNEILYSVDNDKTTDSIITMHLPGYYFNVSGALPHPLNDSLIIFYGNARANSSQKFGYAFLEFNLVNRSTQLHTDSCWTNRITNLLYDSIGNRYIAISNLPLCNGNGFVYGPSYSYFDPNFNLIAPRSDTFPLTYTPHYSTANQFDNHPAMKWTSDSTIMIVGNIYDPLSTTKPSTSMSTLWAHDIGVSIRNASDFSEIDTTMTYGQIDVAEVYYPSKLVKFDSNLYVTAASYEFELFSVGSWDTELTLLGLDENGEKHWMYNFSFGDYCRVQDIHPDDSGGLWVVAQCEEMPGSQAYEKFAKVMYLDSVAFWPRIGTLGLTESENHKGNTFRIYPNPADQMVTIRQKMGKQDAEAEILDVNGRLVKTVVLEDKESTFDVSGLKSGIYFVKIIVKEKRTAIKKLVIR